MQVAQYTSTNHIINNFLRNTSYDGYVNKGDMAYWIYEVMEFIGFPLQYIPKIAGVNNEPDYQMDNWKLKLPCDFHKLMQVFIDGVAAVPSNSTFHHMLDGSCCGLDVSSLPAEEFYDNFGNVFSPNALPHNKTYFNDEPTFTLNDNYITFNIKEGAVCMAYWAFPLDEDGFPMIPKDQKYIRACTAYIQYRIDYILWRQQMLPDKVYGESKQEYEWAVASASNHMKTPDLNQAESMRRGVTKMIVRTEEFRNAFSNLSQSGIRGRY